MAAAGFVAIAGAAAVMAFRRPPAASIGAGSPAEISTRGWRRIAASAWSEFLDDNIMQTAGGVAFFTLLSIFPALAAFVSLYGLFADVGEVPHHLAILAGLLPRSALGFVSTELTRLAGDKHPALGLAFALSLLFSIWSANGAIKALFSGLNTAYEVRERRGLIRLNLVSLAFTLGGLAFVLASLGVVVAAPGLLRALGLSGALHPQAISLLRWPAMFVCTAAALALLYRFGPDRRQAHWRWITPGSLFASAGWLITSMAFSWYVADFGHYERTYGSLGAVVGFMTWLWLSTIVVLAGAELNAETEAEAGLQP